MESSEPELPAGTRPARPVLLHHRPRAGGRVAAATVEVNARPKFGAFDLATSFALPDDKDPLNSDPRCRLWRSESLGAVLGLPYIISVADTVTQTAPAELRASRPHCA